jgi:formylglycine-generating enzyme required for sulfatase activity/tRNA A-37 threonylcarbamoyl transferase component Bud32
LPHIEIRKDGKMIRRQAVSREKAAAGCGIRLGAATKVTLKLGESTRVGKYDVRVVEDTDSPMPPEPGASQAVPRLEGYEIQHRLGEGGMGTVWMGIQLSTKRAVAIKFLSARAFQSERSQRRFAREVEICAKLEHPNIARIYDSGLRHGAYYYAMELVQGVSLDQYAKEHGLGQTQILELMKTVCQAIQHAHQRGVVHRDLKPSNIMVDSDGRPHIVDFGLAKSLLVDSEEKQLTVSIEGDVSGTPAYMSPEQAAGRPDQIDCRTDVFSLGVILYRLLVGQPPHDLSGSRYEVMRRIVENEIRPPRLFGASINADLEGLLRKSMALSPDDRYANAGELARDIENYLLGRPLIARKATAFYLLRKRIAQHRTAVALAAAGTVVAGLVVLGLLPNGWLRERLSLTRIVTVSQAPIVREVIVPATQPQPTVTPPVTHGSLENVVPIKSQADVLWDQLKNLDRGQGLGKQLDAAAAVRLSAQTFFDQRVYDSAGDSYAKFLKLCGDIQDFDSARQRAASARQSWQKSMDAAKQAGAEANATEPWGQAQSLAGQGTDRFDAADFAAAKSFWEQATEALEKRPAQEAMKTISSALSQPSPSPQSLPNESPAALGSPSNSTATTDEVDLTKGLVLHFSFRSAAVNGVVKDESGNGNDGRVVGAKWVAEGQGHGAYLFRAANRTDAIVVPNSLSLNVYQITESAWIKTDVADRWWRRVIDKDWRTGYDLTVGGNWQGNSGRGKVGIDLGDDHIYSDQSVADGRWHHVVATYDGAAQRLYVDGNRQRNIRRRDGTVGGNTHVLRIGNGDLDSKQPDGTTEILAFDGEISDVRIYNRALSQSEIDALKASPTAPPKVPSASALPGSITNSLGTKLLLIPPGTFMMGSPPSEPGRGSDETLHRVTLTKAFYMAATPATVGQFKTFVNDTGYRTDAEREGYARLGDVGGIRTVQGVSWRNPGFSQADDHPVDVITWNDAEAFCDWLTRKEGRAYRLPTEAEWEYACRAGTNTIYYFGDDPSKLGEYAWRGLQTHPVGQRKPNSWGLYDMIGDIFQWCSDWYFPVLDDAVDPQGPPRERAASVHIPWLNYDGACRVLRGGALRSAARMPRPPDRLPANYGFRVVLDAAGIALSQAEIDALKEKSAPDRPVRLDAPLITALARLNPDLDQNWSDPGHRIISDGTASDRGVRNGKFVIRGNGRQRWNQYSYTGPIVCQTRGRSVGNPSDAWGLTFAQANFSEHVVVDVNGEGKVVVYREWPGGHEDLVTYDIPEVGDQFQTLLVRDDGNRLEVSIDGKFLGDPVPLDPPLVSGVVQTELKEGEERTQTPEVEFAYLKIWRLKQ